MDEEAVIYKNVLSVKQPYLPLDHPDALAEDAAACKAAIKIVTDEIYKKLVKTRSSR